MLAQDSNDGHVDYGVLLENIARNPIIGRTLGTAANSVLAVMDLVKLSDLLKAIID